MSVILRHKDFPLVIIYKDPEVNWSKIVKDRIIKEIEEDGFDKFTVIDQEKANLFLGFKPTVKKQKKTKKTYQQRLKNQQRKIKRNHK